MADSSVGTTYTREEKEYLYSIIQNALTFVSDEDEGYGSVIDLREIDICNIDNIDDMEKPLLTKQELLDLLHMNGNGGAEISSDKGDDGGDGDEGFRDYVDNDSKENSLIKNDDADGNPNDIDGTDNDGIRGDVTDGKGDGTLYPDRGDDSGDRDNDYSGIVIPKDADIDKMITDIINDDNPLLQNRVVVEFAQKSIQDDKGVDYELYIKPGQELTEKTIIGKCTINGVTRPIRSIFSKGTVLANEDGSDFYHLYKGQGCNRHFVVENAEYAQEIEEISLDKIESVQNEFKDECTLHQFLVDNICESVLPYILLQRYDAYRYIVLVRWARPNGREIFGDYMDHVNDIREQYMNDMKELGSEKRLKATNGSVRKMREMGDSIIARRRLFAEQMIDCYENYRLGMDKSEYDPDYSDCKYLAYDHKIPEGERETHTFMGDRDYNNYYVALLSKLDLANENKYVKEYFNLLQEIIAIRLVREQYKVEEIAKEFDAHFAKVVNKNFKNPFISLVAAMKEIGADMTYGDVVGWISAQQNSSQSNNYTSYAINQLANIYMLTLNLADYKFSGADIENKYTTYEIRRYPITGQFRFVEGDEYPWGSMNVNLRTFEEFGNGQYVSKLMFDDKEYVDDVKNLYFSDYDEEWRNENGEDINQYNSTYSINLYGVQGRLILKNEHSVYIVFPKLTDEYWGYLKEQAEFEVNSLYDLVRQEWSKLSEFWERVINAYHNVDIPSLIAKVKALPDSVKQYHTWPAASILTAGSYTYNHYLWCNYVDNNNDKDDDIVDEEYGLEYDSTEPQIPTVYPPQDAPKEFLNMNDKDPHAGEPTPKDFKYWVKYFNLATIISIPYLNCGLDIPPFVMMIPLPCIYTCISSIYIEMFDLTMVFGIAIRGMYIWPVILFVNLSDNYLSIMTPLIAQIKNLLNKMNCKINQLGEISIQSLVNGLKNPLVQDNYNLKKENKQLQLYIEQIQTQKVENQEKLKKMSRKLRGKLKKNQNSENQ